MLACASDNGFGALAENGEFLPLCMILNLTAEDDHEPYIEQFNRHIKERCRMVFVGIPFVWFLKRIIVEIVHAQVYWFNFTIPENFISDTLGPAAIILGCTYDYRKISGPGSKLGEYI